MMNQVADGQSDGDGQRKEQCDHESSSSAAAASASETKQWLVCRRQGGREMYSVKEDG